MAVLEEVYLSMIHLVSICRKLMSFFRLLIRCAHISLCFIYFCCVTESVCLHVCTQEFVEQLPAILVLDIFSTNCLYVSSHPAHKYPDVVDMERKKH